MEPKETILLVGTGNMATEYTKVLLAQKRAFIVVGRSENSATKFRQATEVTPTIGGIEKWLKENNSPTTAIVAVNEEQLGPATRALIEHGTKSILVEKPGGLNSNDLSKTKELARKHGSRVFIAYNRRFYSSTDKAREIIKQDGGVISFTFDFTERSHLIEKSDKPLNVKSEWLLANSSHVIDLAFFLGGRPRVIKASVAGGLSWHPKGSIFVGSGVSENKALFSYHANWESAGGWGLEVITPKRKLIFKPLEKLLVQEIGSFDAIEANLKSDLDIKFKPGLYRLVESFLGNKKDLVTLDEQIKSLTDYKLIAKRYV